jgi:AraC-like DNA-binding protein
VVTADPEEARRQLCSAYGTRIRMTAPSPGAVFHLEYTDAGAFRTGHHRLPGDLVLTSEAAPQVVVADLRGGAAQCRYVGGTEDAGPGDVFLSGLPATSHAVRTVDAQVRTVALPLALVYRAAGHVPDQADPPHFTALRPAAPALGDRWRAAAAFTADLLGHPEAMTPLVAANAAHLLAATALAVFPNTATEPDPAPCDTADAAPAALRRAITFIEDNAYRDITLAEIADSAYVTPRALQYAFRRHLGTTPLGYLRDIRLHHAHHDLVDADPATTTVSPIAARWGFLHPGRFAALYRRAYHCPPSSTLHV